MDPSAARGRDAVIESQKPRSRRRPSVGTNLTEGGTRVLGRPGGRLTRNCSKSRSTACGQCHRLTASSVPFPVEGGNRDMQITADVLRTASSTLSRTWSVKPTGYRSERSNPSHGRLQKSSSLKHPQCSIEKPKSDSLGFRIPRPCLGSYSLKTRRKEARPHDNKAPNQMQKDLCTAIHIFSEFSQNRNRTTLPSVSTLIL